MADFKVAILIIGSLIWDKRPHRKAWRRERLQDGPGIPVSAPIRYGRISTSRSCTYTMVFSNELNELVPPRLGWVLAVPCQRKVSTADQLVEEAEELWVAEQSPRTDSPRPAPICISNDWGAVGLLLNPNRTGLDEIRAGWFRRVEEESQNYKYFKHGDNEKRAVDQKGMLLIPWPQKESGDPLDVDLLLATATEPSLTKGAYATPQEIADAWNRAPNRLEYFCENRRVGITTADDCQITEHLRQEDA